MSGKGFTAVCTHSPDRNNPTSLQAQFQALLPSGIISASQFLWKWIPEFDSCCPVVVDSFYLWEKHRTLTGRCWGRKWKHWFHRGQELTCCGWSFQKQVGFFAVISGFPSGWRRFGILWLPQFSCREKRKSSWKGKSSVILVFPWFTPCHPQLQDFTHNGKGLRSIFFLTRFLILEIRISPFGYKLKTSLLQPFIPPTGAWLTGCSLPSCLRTRLWKHWFQAHTQEFWGDNALVFQQWCENSFLGTFLSCEG